MSEQPLSGSRQFQQVDTFVQVGLVGSSAPQPSLAAKPASTTPTVVNPVFARPAPIADRQTEAGPHAGANFPSQFNLLGSIAQGPNWVPTHGILVRPLFSLEFTTWTGAGELNAATRFSITVRASDPSSFWPAST
jgi:hypothetical protein